MTKLSRIAMPVLKYYYDDKVARAKSIYSQNLVKKDMNKHRGWVKSTLITPIVWKLKKQDELITITI